MNAPSPPDEKDPLILGNYAVAFIDLLGQRDSLRIESLLPDLADPATKEAFLKKLRASIGAVAMLQERATQIMDGAAPDLDSEWREKLPPELRGKWDQIARSNISQQVWSDGLMFFTHIGDSAIRCPVNDVYKLIAFSGILCFLGLATGRPLRGAIEIAWGAELRPGELYGAAVARAYELEANVAQYPRIVVGPQFLRFLASHSSVTDGTELSKVSTALATLCLQMLAEDADGHYIVDYLGATFVEGILEKHLVYLRERAEAFIESQLDEHQSTRNSKLAFRYAHLQQYFQHNRSPRPDEA